MTCQIGNGQDGGCRLAEGHERDPFRIRPRQGGGALDNIRERSLEQGYAEESVHERRFPGYIKERQRSLLQTTEIAR